jgi:hypothetical protein
MTATRPATWNSRGTGMQLLNAFDDMANVAEEKSRLQARHTRTNLHGNSLIGFDTTPGTDIWKIQLRPAKNC